MEVVSLARGDLGPFTAPSTAPSTRRTSRASSSPSGESRTPCSAGETDFTIRMPTPSPQPTLPAESPNFAVKNALSKATNDVNCSQTPKPARPIRPPMGRFHSSDAAKPVPLETRFPSPTSQNSSQSSRDQSPLRENDSPLPLAKGETRRRAVSLGDAQTSAGMQPTSTHPRAKSVHDSTFNFLSQATNTPNVSSAKTANYGTHRWHALMELVSTEAGYVKDLKILVRIYLAQLPSVESLAEADRMDIARNAAALLELHKNLARRFNTIVDEERLRELGPGTVSKAAQQKLESAVNRVASIFVKEASSFHLYEAFCAGHSHALDIIRHVQTLPEWDMYEKRCAIIVAKERANAEARSPDSNTMATSNAPTSSVSRRHSIDTGPTADLSISKLTMLDFLIKPVQRICRYPLILGQLQRPAASIEPSSPVNLAIPDPAKSGIELQALKSMREVAAKVDEARKRSDIAIKTKLLLVRISDPPLPQMSSLGDCLLAGSLDVVYHHETVAPLVPPIKVKYLGVFLYGGWILFVKVHKNRTYEPRHWFPLATVTLQEITEEEALLPASFRLSCGEHHFEVVAACASEKTLWMDKIRTARVNSLLRPSELPSSLESPTPKPPTPIKSPNRPPSRKLTTPVTAPSDSVVSPPKRRSSLGALESWQIYLDNPHLLSALDPASTELTSPLLASPPPLPITPAQMKKLLEGDASTILIRRSSANYRKTVDSSLSDVFFEECQTVRVQAQMKEPLFQPPKLTAESGSATAARDKVTRRESVLLRRQRSVAEGTPLVSPTSSGSKFGLARNKSAHSMGSKEMRRRTLAIPFSSFFEEREEEKSKMEQSRPATADYGNFSQPSTPVMAEFDPSPNDGITFIARRKRTRRSISIADRVESPEPVATHPAPPPTSALGLNTLKELPPIPVKRRSTNLTYSLRRPGSDLGRFATFSGTKSGKRPHSTPLPVYIVGQGISNVQPVQGGPTEKSKLRPATIFRKSWTLLAAKSSRGASGLSNLFNRSSLSISREGDTDSSIAHRARSEPASTPPRRISASTPTLGEGLTTWEIVSEAGLLKRPDMPRSASDTSSISDIPPVPPLPRHSQHLQPSPMSSIRRRSSQFVQHLNRLS
ncbi:SubName: Full=Uncharacterized protein {ECO:0000313/EMBL:CCA70682.1} [Serendipita indica DSM 11827]|nr:SubName: Full=Uncharacterized protein {ECO:0000313/EMBL:CCA70682.1} [Serendipita indica DSM 11827]